MMLNLIVRLQSWMRNEEGQDLIEYAMLVALIALFCVVAVGLAGKSVAGIFTDVAAKVAVVPTP